MDLASLCLKAGVKNLNTVFLMTDAQVADERFLVLINDLLASGKRFLALGVTDKFPLESELYKGEDLVQGQKSKVIGMRKKADTAKDWFIESLLSIDAGPAVLALSFLFHCKADSNRRALLVGLDLIMARREGEELGDVLSAERRYCSLSVSKSKRN